MKKTTEGLGTVNEEVWKTHSIGGEPAKQQSSFLVYTKEVMKPATGPSQLSKHFHLHHLQCQESPLCLAPSFTKTGSGELAERGDLTSILACSCPGDFVTSGMSPTHSDLLLYFKGAIIELLKYVFIPSH